MSERLYEDIVEFWIGSADRESEEARRRGSMWFGADATVDRRIRESFSSVPADTAAGLYQDWRNHAHGALAGIVALDQFPRNLYRGSARAFAFDDAALDWSLSLYDSVLFEQLGWMSKVFALMPLQHSEELTIQELSVRRFAELAAQAIGEYREILNGTAQYAEIHRDIVARFGRFPHRNRALGRESTDAERRFLDDGGPTFGQG